MRYQSRFVLPAITAILAIALVLAIVLGSGHDGSSTGSSTSNSDANSNGGFDGAAFPPSVRAHDFTLTNQRGQRVSLSAYRGKVVVLSFLFSKCRTCVLVADQVRGALDEIEGKRDVATIFVSTDPQADTRASVSRFLSETSLQGRVEYLTGTPQELGPIWKAYAIPPVSAGKAASEAGSTILLIDRDGTERIGFGLEQITPESLAHDIRLLAGA
ncbi:MAG TPA: SCO family protein [Solirubrobacteraceae bacterium]|nr:SCO family protein [Solirubrobacteraceae bacterium]